MKSIYSFAFAGMLVSLPLVLEASLCGFQTTCLPATDTADASWQVFGGSLSHRSFQKVKANFTGSRFIKWEFTTGGSGYGNMASPVIGDVNNDGTMEVIIGSGDHALYVLDGPTGAVIWADTVGGGWQDIQATAAIGDIDGDNDIDIVVGSLNDKIYAFDGTTGSVLWTFTTAADVWSSPTIADINGDGYVEVVVGSDDSVLYVLRGTDGNIVWFYSTGKYITSSPVVADVDRDGNPEVVVKSCDGYVYVLRGSNGSLKWRYYFGSGCNSSPAVGDINGDGNPEVLAGGHRIYALEGSTGSALWVSDSMGPTTTPAIGDIDQDGYTEVVVGSADNTLYILNGTDGSILHSVAIPNGDKLTYSSLNVIADVDPTSPGLEIVENVNNSSCCGTTVVSSDGTILWIYSGGDNQTSVAVGDIDGDGCSEIVMAFRDDHTIRALDATSNTGGCGTVGETKEEPKGKTDRLSLDPNDMVEIYTSDGRLIYAGKYGSFKASNGIYFVKIGDKVIRVIK